MGQNLRGRPFARILLAAVLLLVALAVAAPLALRVANGYQVDGEAKLAGLGAQVEVLRDENGVPYLRAGNADDLWRGNGYVAAQDRMFQMHLTRLAAAGRLSELAGAQALGLDKRMRALGFRRLADRQAAALDAESRRFFQLYADGVNAFLASGQDLHLEFKAAGIAPEPWQVEDSLAIVFLMSWRSSANLQHELVQAELAARLGPRAGELAPLNRNPDDAALPAAVENEAPAAEAPAAAAPAQTAALATGDEPFAALVRTLQDDGLLGAAAGLGSNNWAMAGHRSPSGKPIVANDPHLDTRMLPGVWHPLGLGLPGKRAVGFAVPGLPGLTLGRNERLAMGVTNAYVDLQDLYVETLDPANAGHYLEGGASIPFEVHTETLKVRDGEAPGGFREEKLELRATRRGPVVSDFLEEKPRLADGTVWTLRWAPAETMASRLRFDDLLSAGSAAELDRILEQVTIIGLNFVFADADGHLGFRVTGRAPVRATPGSLPRPVPAAGAGPDDWQGYLPAAEMPQLKDPARGWLGTANHLTIGAGFPGYFTDFAASSYRYRRMAQLLDGTEPLSVEEHWRIQLDVKNLLAERLAPLMAEALAKDLRTADLAAQLKGWNHEDVAGAAAPLIFQETLRQSVLALVGDELGPELAQLYLEDLYLWQERVEEILATGTSSLIDDVGTPAIETRDQLFVRAALAARAAIVERQGEDMQRWRWGKVHTMDFYHPLRRSGFGVSLLGGGSHPYAGSAETLMRAWYDMRSPYPVTHSASLRFVADLGDPDRLRYVLPGGVVDRAFHRHHHDQIDDFLEGRALHLWLSDSALAAHQEHRLVLAP